MRYISLGDHTGIWTLAGNELHFDRLKAAHDRIVKNRRFLASCTSGDSGHRTIEGWLQELATQTRKRVMTGGGCLEPGSVSQLTSFSSEAIEWLREDEVRLRELDDKSFETLLMQAVGAAGYHVRAVGPTRRKDGGVDLVLWPERDIPYVIAVQVKHHREDNSTGVGDARDFYGALRRNTVFSFGLLVTNTRFTEDATAFCEGTEPALRLRDGRAVCRWLGGDFSDAAEWKEIPGEVRLAPGVTIDFRTNPKLSDLDAEVSRARTILNIFLPQPRGADTPFGR